jgi:hypothetical protein
MILAWEDADEASKMEPRQREKGYVTQKDVITPRAGDSKRHRHLAKKMEREL